MKLVYSSNPTKRNVCNPSSVSRLISKPVCSSIWFKSYPCEFKESINTSYRSPSHLLCGVPQGSPLGQLLFLLYINNLLQAATSNSLRYADNTCIVFHHKSVIEIEKQLIKDCSSLLDWHVGNKLSVFFGQDKTKSILFGTRHKVKR